MTNLTSVTSQFRSSCSSKKHRYISALVLTSTGRKMPAKSPCASKNCRNTSGIILFEEIIYGFPLKKGIFSRDTPDHSPRTESIPGAAYSQIISIFECSLFSFKSAPREISMYAQHSRRMSCTISSKLFSDSSIFTMEVITSFL